MSPFWRVLPQRGKLARMFLSKWVGDQEIQSNPTEVTDTLFQNKKYQLGHSTSGCIHWHFHSSLRSMGLSIKQLAAPTRFAEIKISSCAFYAVFCSHLFPSNALHNEKNSTLNFKIALLPLIRFYTGKDWNILLLKYWQFWK